MQDRNDLRASMRKRRLALSAAQQLDVARALTKQLGSHPLFLKSQRIAAYIPTGGEADPLFLVKRAWDLGKSVYLPVLAPLSQQLWFLPFTPKTRLAMNRFAIPEPDTDPRKRISPFALDLVLTPLVAFDKVGNRLGMGGGYYDTSFAFLCRRQCWYKPFLLGVGHQFQQVRHLQPQAWDIPLAGIVTESRLQLLG